VQHIMFLHHVQLCASVLTSDEVTYRGFVRGYGAFLDSHGPGGYRVFGMGGLGGCDIGFARKLMFLYCVGGGLLMSFMQDVFRGLEISSLLLSMTKKGGPSLKMLCIGNSGLGINIPLENLIISGWLTKRQGGGSIFQYSVGSPWESFLHRQIVR
jgi:hypothetical protein